MTNRGNDGHVYVGNGPGDDLFVELPQIFHAAAAARDNDEIDRCEIFAELGQLANRDRDFLGGAGSLDPDRANQDLKPRRAAAQHIKDVADRGAAGRGDNSNTLREFWQGSFARGIEKPFGFEFALQRFELRL